MASEADNDESEAPHGRRHRSAASGNSPGCAPAAPPSHLLDPVMVEAYGSDMPLTQVGTVNVPEPRMITVQVWDRGLVKAVEKAIRDAGLGLNPHVRRPARPRADAGAEPGAPPGAVEGRAQIRRAGPRRRAQRAPRRHGSAEEAGEGPQDLRRTSTAQRSDEVQKITDEHIKKIDEMLVAEGKRNHAGLSWQKRSPSSGRRVAAASMSPSSWTATAAGRRRAACRAPSAISAAPRPCARTVMRRGELGISYLTLFGFSSENWKRPAREVDDLMGLLRLYLRSEIAELHRNGVRLRVIGDRERLAPDIVALIEQAETRTRGNCAAQPDRRAELWRARRDRAGGRAHRAKMCKAGKLAARRRRRGAVQPPPADRRAARSRPRHPHQRREAHQQLPALAVGLCGAGLPRAAVARLHQGRSRGGDPRIPPPRPAVRCRPLARALCARESSRR